MKTLKSKVLALAIVALGMTVGITACKKDDDKDVKNADFAGTYYGSYDILSIIEVEDTLVVTNLEEPNKINVFSHQLDTSFTATVKGSTATFDGFSANSFTAGEVSLTGIDVKAGRGTLNKRNGRDELDVVLTGVDVENAEGSTVPDALKKLFPMKNQRIRTKEMFIKQ